MKKILIVEDDIFLAKVYQKKLGAMGFELVVVNDGERVFEIAKQDHPSIILLDVILPKKSGFDVLSELKADDSTRNIPVLMVSNMALESEIQKAKDMGVSAYMIKSNYSFKEVTEKIIGLIGAPD